MGAADALAATVVAGLAFLVGPLSDLASGSDPAGTVVATAVAVAAFAAVYLALLPPVRRLARRGAGAIRGALVLLAALSAMPVASSLHLSEGTVRNYLSAAIRKLDARNRGEAVETAREKGWL